MARADRIGVVQRNPRAHTRTLAKYAITHILADVAATATTLSQRDYAPTPTPPTAMTATGGSGGDGRTLVSRARRTPSRQSGRLAHSLFLWVRGGWRVPIAYQCAAIVCAWHYSLNGVA